MKSQTHSRSLPADLSAPPMVDSWRRHALPVAGVLSVIAIIGAFVNTGVFLRAYLTGYMLCLGASLGCMALLMVQHLAGGKWGIANRRVFEAAARNMPLMFILFLPIAIGVRFISPDQMYGWMGPHRAMIDDAWRAANWKSAWLNYWFWLARWVIYFAIWCFYAWRLSRWSLERDADTRDSLLKWQTKLENLSGFGVVVYALTITAASVDWIMSFDVTWFSTMYGLIYLCGQGLLGLALGIIMMTLLARDEPMASVLRVTELHDNGKLLFAFVMLFAYVSFSQFLIIWMGNLPEEITWYNMRTHGGWGYVAFCVAVFHFCLPWLVLLSRDVKRHMTMLRRIAYFMVFMRLVDLFWEIEPNFSYNTAGKLVSVNFIEKFVPHIHIVLLWQYLFVPPALGAIWFVFFCSQLRKAPLIPINDPQIHEVLLPEHSHAAV